VVKIPEASAVSGWNSIFYGNIHVNLSNPVTDHLGRHVAADFQGRHDFHNRLYQPKIRVISFVFLWPQILCKYTYDGSGWETEYVWVMTMMMWLFGELLNLLRIVLGYWCQHYNEQCKFNSRSMPIQGKTTTLWYVVQWPRKEELHRANLCLDPYVYWRMQTYAVFFSYVEPLLNVNMRRALSNHAQATRFTV